MRARRRAATVIAAVVAVTTGAACEPLPPPAAGSALIGCDRADERVKLLRFEEPACVKGKLS